MLIDDGYSELVLNQYLIRRMTDSERNWLRFLITEGHTEDAEDFLFTNRVTTLSGKVVIPDEHSRQQIGEMLVSWPTEKQDLQNLKQAGSMMLRNPRLGLRSCELCKQWWFDEDTGLVVKIGPQNLRRPAHAPLACDTIRGCPKGHWSKPIELSDRNRKAFEHWVANRDSGCPAPHDAILKRNWRWLEALARHYGFGSHRRTARIAN